MIRTTVRQLLERKLRLLTTGVAIVLGVAFMAGTLILTDTLERSFDVLFVNQIADRAADYRTTRRVNHHRFAIQQSNCLEQFQVAEAIDLCIEQRILQRARM